MEERPEPNTTPEPVFAIVEIMGHRRYGAKVSTVQEFGGTFLRAEVLTSPPYEQLVAPSSVFAITRCTEDQARAACSFHGIPAELRAGLPAPERLALESGGELDDPDLEHDDLYDDEDRSF